jgi:hypothetical protein
MRTRTTVILAVLGAAVLALGVIYGSGPRERTQTAVQGQIAFPDLVAKLAAATRIEITHKGLTLHLARADRDAPTWGVADRGGYPAQQDKVHELLTGLTELRLDEPRTSDPASYARLGVEDPAAKGADSTLVRVLDGNGGVIAALVVGHARPSQHGDADTLYVRRPDAAQAWLADGHIAVTSDSQDWVDRDIVNIDPAKIATDMVTRGDATLTFGRVDGAFTLTAPADHPKLDDLKVQEVNRVLADLTLEDVKPAPAPGTPLGRAVITTTDGMTVTVAANKSGPELWATFTAEGKDAAALAAKLKGWAYLIGSWKEQALVPTLDNVKAPPPPAPPAAAAAPAPAQPPIAVPPPAPPPAPAPDAK